MSRIEERMNKAFHKVERTFSALEKYCNELNVNVNSAIAIYESGSKKVLIEKLMKKCEAYSDAKKEYRALLESASNI